MGELKQLDGSFVIIKRKDGEEFIMRGSLDEWLKLVNNGPQFIPIGWGVVNKFEIFTIEPYIPSDIDGYIAWITDKEVRDGLKGIVKERKNKWLEINGVKHLVDIYESRYWKIWEQKE